MIYFLRQALSNHFWKTLIVVGLTISLGWISFAIAQKENNSSTIEKNKNRIYIQTFLGNDKRRFYGRGKPQGLDIISKYYLGRGISHTYKTGYKYWYGAGWTGQGIVYFEDGKPYYVIGSYDHNLKKLDLEALLNPGLKKRVLVWNYEFPDIVKGTPTVFFNEEENGFVLLKGSRYGKQENNRIHFGLPYIWSFRAIKSKTGRELFRVNAERTLSQSRDNDGSSIYLPDKKMVFNASENAIGYFINIDKNKFQKIPHKHIRGEKKRGKTFYRPEIKARFILYKKKDKKGRSEIYPEGSPARVGNFIFVTSGSGHLYGINLDKVDFTNPGKLQYPHWDLYIQADTQGSVVVSKDNKLFITMEKQFIPGKGGVMKINPSFVPKDSVEWFMPTGDTPKQKMFKGGIIGSAAINDEYISDDGVPLVATNTVEGKVYIASQNTLVKNKKVLGPRKKKYYATPKIVFKGRIGWSISTPIFTDGNMLITAGGARVHFYKLKFSKSTFKDKKAILNLKGLPYRVKVSKIGSVSLGAYIEATPIVYNGKVIIACRNGYLYVIGKK